ncbi:MAG: hypoxanthine phosphoribosyltransferase [Phycisphaerales bacterium]|nr:hypoxanthine phosphoribosyltransferase [Phycisphaerales bacterium]
MFPEVRVLIDEHRIAARVRAMGEEIARDLAAAAGPDGRVMLIPVMTGSIIFVADLIRCMPVRLHLGVVTVSSYAGAATESAGAALRGQIPPGLAGTHVLVIDDILDSGQTLALVQSLIAEQRPASLRTCVLLRKARTRRADPPVDFVGFDIGGEFVVGYGLDHDGLYRNLPWIGVPVPAVAQGRGGGPP